jgi:hypothetical protein
MNHIDRDLAIETTPGEAVPAEQMNEAEVQNRTRGLPDALRRSVVCALVGHSRIVKAFFGYVYCFRCGSQIGDVLAGVFDLSAHVIIAHDDCEECRANAATLTWRDTLETPPWSNLPLGERA